MAIKGRLRFEILKRDGYRCFYCHDSEKKLTVDHVIPTALGGTDDPTNLVAACGTCNNGKASTNPEAPLVAQAREDAMRWQMAWDAAVAEATRGGEQRKKDIAKVKKNYVAAYRGRHGENPILPEGWEASVGRWLDLGLPMACIDKAIASAVGRRKILPENRWNYFAGACWNMQNNLGDRARQIAEAAAPEPWGEMVTRTILDTAVLVWHEALKIENEREPQPGELDAVRKSAEALYPAKVYSGALLKAAYDAAEHEDTDLSHWIDGDDYFDADPFHLQVAKAVLSGWTDGERRAGNPLTPERWNAVLRQALAAREAGYEAGKVREAAYFSGIHSQPLLEFLVTGAESFKADAEFHDSEARDCALTQEELDELAAGAWEAKSRREQEAAERAAAGDSWYSWHPDYRPVDGGDASDREGEN